jgi:hypothetical protein
VVWLEEGTREVEGRGVAEAHRVGVRVEETLMVKEMEEQALLVKLTVGEEEEEEYWEGVAVRDGWEGEGWELPFWYCTMDTENCML